MTLPAVFLPDRDYGFPFSGVNGARMPQRSLHIPVSALHFHDSNSVQTLVLAKGEETMSPKEKGQF
jgi:hypothetical protein